MATKPQTNTVDFFIGLPKEFKPVSSSNNSNDDNGGRKQLNTYYLQMNGRLIMMHDCFKRKLLIMDILKRFY